MCMQVRGEGGVGVGAGNDGAVVVIFLRDRDPLGSGELLFQVTGDGLLLNEGGGALARPCVVQGLACDSHGSDESLLFSMRGSSGSLSHSRGVVLLPIGCGSGDGLLPVDGGEVGVATR
jgi:hypothetical protein